MERQSVFFCFCAGFGTLPRRRSMKSSSVITVSLAVNVQIGVAHEKMLDYIALLHYHIIISSHYHIEQKNPIETEHGIYRDK